MLLKICNMQKICSFYLIRNKGIIITIIRKIESYTYIDLEIIQIKDNIYSTELKPWEIVTFLCFTWKITHKWALKILATRFTFIVERGKKTCIFTQKWLDHLLLMTSYLATTATDHHWTCLKMCARDERTGTENVMCWRFILEEKSSKKSGGDPPPPLPIVLTGVNGPVKLFWFKCNIEDSIVLHLTW